MSSEEATESTVSGSAPGRREVRFKSIPRSEIPDQIGDMPVTPQLLEEYKGHEVLLKQRAKHPEHCYPAFDAVRLCLLGRLDKPTCEKIAQAYAPCAKEVKKAKLARIMAQDEERRKILAAKSKVLGTGDGS